MDGWPRGRPGGTGPRALWPQNQTETRLSKLYLENKCPRHEGPARPGAEGPGITGTGYSSAAPENRSHYRKDRLIVIASLRRHSIWGLTSGRLIVARRGTSCPGHSRKVLNRQHTHMFARVSDRVDPRLLTRRRLAIWDFLLIGG